MKATTQTEQHQHLQDKTSYSDFMKMFQDNFRNNTDHGKRPLFRAALVNGVSLPEVYLQSFPESNRQFHNCAACKSFIRRFGTLRTSRYSRSSLVSSHTGCIR